MNLYVFQVDTGSTYIFELNLVNQNVKVLKQEIKARTGIPENKQALLISGGETLFDDARICSYRAAGTETNPIFLFNRENVDRDNPPSPMVDYGTNVDMKDRIKSCLNMEPTYNTVVSRAELAQQLYDMANQQLNSCERLVQDQHLQHQGWGAVIANLEDLAKALMGKLEVMRNEFAKFKEKKPLYSKIIEQLSYDIDLLSHIPLLPGLIDPILKEENANPTLLDWIGFRWSTLKDLKVMATTVSNFHDNSHEAFMATIEEEKKLVMSEINKKEVKEIKGLQNRLQMLDGLMSRARKLTHELGEHAQAFYQNQQRVSNLRDTSILPDLCKSHEAHLKVMSDNYLELREVKEKCINAKREFCIAIHRRLQWVSHVSKQITSLTNRQTLWVNHLQRIEKHINIFQQVQRAPEVYFNLVIEVYRRRIISQRFLSWAKDISIQSRSFHETEVDLRKKFKTNLSNHFLRALFPGMDDEPTEFAVNEPTPFDDRLPEITSSDIQKLIEQFPQYSALLKVPLDVPSPLSRFISSPIEEINVCSPRRHESDNDDFETVNSESKSDVKSNIDSGQTQDNEGSDPCSDFPEEKLKSQPSFCEAAIDTCDDLRDPRIDALEDELTLEKLAKLELVEKCENLQLELNELKQFWSQKVPYFQANIKDLRLIMQDNKQATQNDIVIINSQFNEVFAQSGRVIQDLIKRLSIKEKEWTNSCNDLTAQLDELKLQRDSSIDQANSLREESSSIKSELESAMKKLNEKDAMINQLNQEKADLLKGHKSEIETLRSRYKMFLTTSTLVERTPSENSLEKVHSDKDTFEMSSQSKSLYQQSDDGRSSQASSPDTRDRPYFDQMTKLRQDNDAYGYKLKSMEMLNAKLLKPIMTKLEEIKRSTNNQEIVLRLKTIEILFSEFFDALDSLPSPISSPFINLKSLVGNKCESMMASTIMDKSTKDISLKKRPLDLFEEPDKISYLSCDLGDVVLLTYHSQHNSFIVFTSLPVRHFLHNECLEALNLKIAPDSDANNWALGIITDKVFCQASKPQNRYNVPVNTKFYRVKAKPWSRATLSRRSPLSSTSSVSSLPRTSSGIMAYSTIEARSQSPVTSPDQPGTSISMSYISPTSPGEKPVKE